jgi:hypothetical protein
MDRRWTAAVMIVPTLGEPVRGESISTMSLLNCIESCTQFLDRSTKPRALIGKIGTFAPREASWDSFCCDNSAASASRSWVILAMMVSGRASDQSDFGILRSRAKQVLTYPVGAKDNVECRHV